MSITVLNMNTHTHKLEKNRDEFFCNEYRKYFLIITQYIKWNNIFDYI